LASSNLAELQTWVPAGSHVGGLVTSVDAQGPLPLRRIFTFTPPRFAELQTSVPAWQLHPPVLDSACRSGRPRSTGFRRKVLIYLAVGPAPRRGHRLPQRGWLTKPISPSSVGRIGSYRGPGLSSWHCRIQWRGQFVEILPPKKGTFDVGRTSSNCRPGSRCFRACELGAIWRRNVTSVDGS